MQVVADVPVLRIDVLEVRHRIGVLLEVKEEKPRASADRPVVGDLVGDVRVDDEALDRRLLRAPGHEAVMGVARAEAVFGRNAETKREAPERRSDYLEVRKDEKARIHRRALVLLAVTGNANAPTRVLRNESNLDCDVCIESETRCKRSRCRENRRSQCQKLFHYVHSLLIICLLPV